MFCYGNVNFRGYNVVMGGFDIFDFVVFDFEVGYFVVLNDVDVMLIGFMCIVSGYCIVLCCICVGL